MTIFTTIQFKKLEGLPTLFPFVQSMTKSLYKSLSLREKWEIWEKHNVNFP